MGCSESPTGCRKLRSGNAPANVQSRRSPGPLRSERGRSVRGVPSDVPDRIATWHTTSFVGVIVIFPARKSEDPGSSLGKPPLSFTFVGGCWIPQHQAPRPHQLSHPSLPDGRHYERNPTSVAFERPRGNTVGHTTSFMRIMMLYN